MSVGRAAGEASTTTSEPDPELVEAVGEDRTRTPLRPRPVVPGMCPATASSDEVRYR